MAVWLPALVFAQTDSQLTAKQDIISQVRQQAAPDKRVAIFQVEADSTGRLTGKTNLPDAKQTLLNQLTQKGLSFRDEIQVLPASVLGEESYAIVNISVANLRSNPREAAELATQALLGMPLRVWDKDRGWYLVQTPDQYIAWVDFGGLQRMKKADFDRWESAEKIIYTHPFGFCYSEPNTKSQTVSDLVAGDRLILEKEEKKYFRARFPDGRIAYVSKTEAQRYADWAKTAKPTEESLVNTAKHMMGIPYLWGGTSYKGMDCSGFTKTVYFLNGQTLPRDASQQVHVGELIATPDKNFANLKPGDLLFFGEPATADKGERVVHVGMWIGNNEFIHASGKIRISSMNPTAPNFDEHELKRFLRAKRMIKDNELGLR